VPGLSGFTARDLLYLSLGTKLHLQELAKAGLNGMEQTVEKYIESITPDAASSIASPSTLSDSSMMAQMVLAIKQKLLSVATELVSSALKGGDRQVVTCDV
jgi:hypothetical protein